MFAPTLPALAAAIAEWFPELDGRSVAIAAPINLVPETPPSLPLVTVALAKEDVLPNSTQKQPKFNDTIVVEFWWPPERYKRSNGTETPFFSFYDYERIRDRLLTYALEWHTPRNMRLNYKGLMADVTTYAVIIGFKFTAEYQFCPIEEEGNEIVPSELTADGDLFNIKVTRVIPETWFCNEPAEPREEPT